MEVLKPQKILFIQTAFIGDAVLTLPAIQEYKKENPSYLVDVLCIPATAEIFSCSPYVNDVVILDKKKNHKGLLSFLKFCKKINLSGYRKIYSFHRSFRTSFLVYLSGVAESYGFDTSSLKSVYTSLVHYDNNIHEVERNFSLAGLNRNGWKQVLPIMDTSDSLTDKQTSDLNLRTPYVIVAPGTVWETKKYPADYFREIVEFLSEEFQVVLIGSKQEIELCDSLRVNNNVISAAGKLSIPGTVEMMKKAFFVICNDSAPSHFGVAANRPVLMLYCSTIPAFGFYPYNTGSSWLSFDELDCKPCGIHGYNKCPLRHFKCGYELKPDTVIKYIKENYLSYDRSFDL